jgi:hypothetical protein
VKPEKEGVRVAHGLKDGLFSRFVKQPDGTGTCG